MAAVTDELMDFEYEGTILMTLGRKAALYGSEVICNCLQLKPDFRTTVSVNWVISGATAEKLSLGREVGAWDTLLSMSWNTWGHLVHRAA